MHAEDPPALHDMAQMPADEGDFYPRQMAVEHMAKAIILDEGGKTSEADKESTLATETDSRNPELFILKAHLLARRNKIDEAIAAVREAIKRDAKRASFHAELARLLMTKPGGAKEAVEAVRKAIASTGESVKLLLLLGDCQRAAEDFDGARSTYEKALSVGKGKAPDATLGIAETYKSKKDWNKALEFFEKAKNEFMLSAKKQAYCLTEMGKIIEDQQNDKKKALDTYKAAQGADASYPPPYFLIAKFFALDKDPAKRETAYTLLEKYLEYDPKGEYAEKAKEFLKDRKPAPAPKR